MKILGIRLKNLHSLKGEHTIDFQNSRLSDAGLFLISGPTGSGKSTLLDAITLALFNRIPRNGAGKITKEVIEREGFILTRNANDCYAEVTYECKGKSYISSWKIERNRNGKLKDRVHVLSDALTHEIISEGVEAVPSKNAEIIGLSYEQLVQSMILAQGQFSRLLLASREERNTLLEKITGTEFYRTIGQKAYDRFIQSKRELENEKLVLSATEMLTDQEEQEKRNALQTLQDALIVLEAENKVMADKQAVKKEIHDLQNDLKRLQNIKTQLDEEAKNVTPIQERYAAYLRLVPLLSDYDKWKNLLTQNNASAAEIDTIKAEIQLLNDQLEQLVEELVAKTYLEKGDDLQEKSHLLLGEIKVLSSRMDLQAMQLQNQLQTKKACIQKLKSLDPYENWEVKNILDLHDKAQQIGLLLAQQSIETELDIRDKRLTINEQKQKVSDFRLKWSLWKSTVELSGTFKTDIETSNVQLKKNEEELKDLIPKQERLEKEAVAAEKELKQAEANRSLHEFRTDLVEGEPCPLCGALEHPAAVELSEQALQLVRNTLQLALENKNQNQQRILVLQDRLKQLESDIQKKKHSYSEQVKNAAEIEAKLKEMQQEWKLTDEISEQLLVDKENTLKAQSEEVESFSKALQIQVNIQDLLPVLEEIERCQHELDAAKKEWQSKSQLSVVELERLVKNTGDFNLLLQDKEKELKRKMQLFEENRMQEGTMKQGIEDLFSVYQITDWSDFENSNLTPEKANECNQMINSYNVKLTAFETNWKNTHLKLEANLAQDDVAITWDEVTEKLEVLKTQLSQNQQEIGGLKQVLEINAATKQAFAKKQEHIASLQKEFDKWSIMNRLIGEKGGKNFSNFVQDLTMKQLLEFGNQRLRSFSDRYILILTDENVSDSLQVVDMHMGQVRRSVSSLSGGETFRLSLALAFGLSDLAAGNVEINSLFIDEGFGTLDADSLDQAIGILEDIQNKGNKLIGIISHVAELKERISAKINIVPNGPGFSRIEVE